MKRLQVVALLVVITGWMIPAKTQAAPRLVFETMESVSQVQTYATTNEVYGPKQVYGPPYTPPVPKETSGRNPKQTKSARSGNVAQAAVQEAELTTLKKERVGSKGYKQGQKVGDGQCVTFAKHYTGVFGTWGNGGRRLKVDQNPQVGDVVVFKATHVAIIQAIEGKELVLIEQNYDIKGRVSVGRRVKIGSSSIRGYYHP